MSKYQITLETTIDTDSGKTDNGLFWVLARHCCPHDFELKKEKGCNMTDCGYCWIKAVQAGEKADAKFIHVERLG